MTHPACSAKASPKRRLRKLASGRCDRLVQAVKRGDLAVATAVLDADPWVYFTFEQAKAVIKACVTAANAIDLLAIFCSRNKTLFRVKKQTLADMSFLLACRHCADVAAVEHIVRFLCDDSRPDVEKGLLVAMKTQNLELVEHLLTAFEPVHDRDYGALILAAIETKSQAFALRFMFMPAVLAFLASLEVAFEPRYNQHVVTHHQPHEWLVQAVVCGMRAVVELAAERAPLFTADVVFVQCPPMPDASFLHLCARRESLNRQIQAFHRAIHAGEVDVVDAMLKKEPVLGRSQMDRGETALLASALAPNSIALLECFHQLTVTNKTVCDAFLGACRLGAAPASVKLLWKWVESFTVTEYQRETVLWDGISRAMSQDHVAVLNALLPNVVDWSSGPIQGYLTQAMSEWTSECTQRFVMTAIRATKGGDFAAVVVDVSPVQDVFQALQAKMVCAASAGMDYGSCSSYCDCPRGRRECDFAETAMLVNGWIAAAIRYNMVAVVNILDKWWPALTRKAAFVHCNKSLPNDPDLARWWTLRDRYVQDVTWFHFCNAHLVQRRMLPGLDPLGSHIASYLHAFDTKNQLDLLGEEEGYESEGRDESSDESDSDEGSDAAPPSPFR